MTLQAPIKVKRPRIAVAMCFEREPMGPAYESMTMSLCSQYAEWLPITIGSTVVHLARNQMIEMVRNDPTIDGLIMVDSDQVWGPTLFERLLRWDVPCVAPVIPQRSGQPMPVSYVHVGLDEHNQHRYNPIPPLQAIGAYWSMFNPERIAGPTCQLPYEPDHPPKMLELPPNIREGLNTPLYQVDAMGTGLVYFSGAMIRSLPVPQGSNPSNPGWFSFTNGGEDFHFMRHIKDAGYPLFVDRGCVAGHLTTYARAGDDIWKLIVDQERDRRTEEAKTANLPPATDLAAKLQEMGQANVQHALMAPKPWDATVLPTQGTLVA